MIRIVLISTVLGLTSCSFELTKPQAPANVVSMDTMTMILKEEILIGAYVEENLNGLAKYHKVLTASSEAIIEKYKIEPARFEMSLDFYALRDDLMTVIYSDIQKELESMKKIN
jgi:hypothetical protein